ncbi:MAG TPA: MFS transporter [Streptosporangiaceae bacterium]|nr:MFS transporter [Streptosporangiaceae bacterium]
MTRDSHDGPTGAAPPAPDRRRWFALVVVLVAGFMDLLDVTIVNVAVPSILRDLDAAYAQVEWVITGYLLGFAALLITGGRLGDSFGRKRMFLVGVGGFTVASALCGLATTPAVLIGARFFEGAMAGLMVPQILAIIYVTFPPEERGKVLGLWGGVLGSASAAGLVAGGLLVRWDLAGLGWRPIFLINVPVGLAAMIAARFVVRESRSAAAPGLDPIGMVLAVSAVLMLVYPLTEGRSLGWPAWSYGLMAGSAAVLAGFVAYERRRTRTRSPLVALGLFRARAFSVGLAVWLIFWVALGGFFLMWTLYMQVGLGWTPLRAGLTAATFAAGGTAGAGLSVQVLTPLFGRRVLMAGALVNAAGFGGYAWVAFHYGPAVHPWQMVAPLVGAGFGFGMVVAPMVDLILSGVPVRDAGAASGVLSTIQQVGLALGVALVGVVFFGLLAGGSGRGVDAVTPGVRDRLAAVGVPPAGQEQILAGFRACVHDRSAATDPTVPPPSCRRVGAAAPAQVERVLADAGARANAHNFSRTLGDTLWYAIAILVVVFLGLFALPRRVRLADPAAETAGPTADADGGEPPVPGVPGVPGATRTARSPR